MKWLAFTSIVVASLVALGIYSVMPPTVVWEGRVPHCPKCRTDIAPYDNIPVLSYLVLRGRCRHCGLRIALRYPLVEALTGALFVACFLRFTPSSGPTFLLLFVIAVRRFLVVGTALA